VPLAAIVLAGGRGVRLQSEVNKVFLPVLDRAVLEYSVRTFQIADRVSRVIIAIRPEDRYRLDHLVNRPKGPPLDLVGGGATRHQSEMSAIESISAAIEAGVIDLVAIHDGARPFMTIRLLDACTEAADRFGGAVPGLPPEAPLYEVGEAGIRAVSLEGIMRVQTPQVFRARPLLAAYRASLEAGFEGVDTAETIQKFTDVEVAIVPGDPRNLKITYVEDLIRAEEMAKKWADGRWRI
jgi:2-C-methyl-D-erythritol 4-phosphate cytidylyltransferase